MRGGRRLPAPVPRGSPGRLQRLSLIHISVSISRLKESDKYERAIDGYLPTADVVFLDVYKRQA